MGRIQFIELHEQPWLPSSIRDHATDALQFGFSLLDVYAPIVPMLQRALEATGQRSIVDLCSGGGGPWLEIHRKLQKDIPELRITLTDKFPNSSAVHDLSRESCCQIGLYPAPVDALNVPSELRGFRTIFTSFHHFPPEEARAILENAVESGEGIGIFESTRRAASSILLMPGWVLLLILCTPWIRPFRWSRLFWTYVISIIPLVLLWDGLVSCLRTYRYEELRAMVETLTEGDFQWEIGQTQGRIPILYMVGLPAKTPLKQA